MNPQDLQAREAMLAAYLLQTEADLRAALKLSGLNDPAGEAAIVAAVLDAVRRSPPLAFLSPGAAAEVREAVAEVHRGYSQLMTLLMVAYARLWAAGLPLTTQGAPLPSHLN